MYKPDRETDYLEFIKNNVNCTGILKLLQLVRIIYNIIQSRRTIKRVSIICSVMPFMKGLNIFSITITELLAIEL